MEATASSSSGLKLFHSTERFIGMDFVDPPIDFAALARSLGMSKAAARHEIDVDRQSPLPSIEVHRLHKPGAP